MRRLQQLGIWGTMAAVGLLIVLSIVEAFLGADAAARFFNSRPMVVFWFALAALFLLGFIAFRGLRERPGLVAMHLGALFILGGAMWGSDRGHALGNRPVASARMVIPTGETVDGLFDAEGLPLDTPLPFALRLNDFRIEYYPVPWNLSVGTLVHRGPQTEELIPWSVGCEFTLPHTAIRGCVLQYLPYARLTVDAAGAVTAAEARPAAAALPAMQLRLTSPDGRSREAWIAPLPHELYAELALDVPRPTPAAAHGGDFVLAQSLFLAPPPMGAVKDYLSDVTVVQGGLDVARKTIEVNHPLHWGGYYFCQGDYDHEAGRYTLLLVRSDRGLSIVYAGFVFLVAGAFWHFWIVPILRRLASRSQGSHGPGEVAA